MDRNVLSLYLLVPMISFGLEWVERAQPNELQRSKRHPVTQSGSLLPASHGDGNALPVILTPIIPSIILLLLKLQSGGLMTQQADEVPPEKIVEPLPPLTVVNNFSLRGLLVN